MEGNNEKTTKEKVEESASAKIEAKPLFSQREMRNITKDFISAWLNGQIKLHFPSCEEFLETEKKKGTVMEYNMRMRLKSRLKPNLQTLSIFVQVQ